MTSIESIHFADRDSGDAWSWWNSRRLQYNLTLGAAGWIAYGLAVAENYAFGHPVWAEWRGALGVSLFMAVIYVLIMGAANVAYLLGPALEGWLKLDDIAAYRRTAYAAGRWGSLIVPFSFPAVVLAMLLGASR